MVLLSGELGQVLLWAESAMEEVEVSRKRSAVHMPRQAHAGGQQVHKPCSLPLPATLQACRICITALHAGRGAQPSIPPKGLRSAAWPEFR